MHRKIHHSHLRFQSLTYMIDKLPHYSICIFKMQYYSINYLLPYSFLKKPKKPRSYTTFLTSPTMLISKTISLRSHSGLHCLPNFPSQKNKKYLALKWHVNRNQNVKINASNVIPILMTLLLWS